jgi:L-lactate dehydrogenase complex protein LldE
MMHEYWPQLFAGTDLEDAALKTSQQVSEFSSFVADKFGPELFSGARTTGDGVAVYHDSCHMMRVLGIRDAPRRLLAYVKNLDVRELEAPERCCGFGGTFSLRYPELASAMADEKVNDATAQGASVLVSSDIGCLMHICGRAGSRGTPLDGRYIAEMLVDERNP